MADHEEEDDDIYVLPPSTVIPPFARGKHERFFAVLLDKLPDGYESMVQAPPLIDRGCGYTKFIYVRDLP